MPCVLVGQRLGDREGVEGDRGAGGGGRQGGSCGDELGDGASVGVVPPDVPADELPTVGP